MSAPVRTPSDTAPEPPTILPGIDVVPGYEVIEHLSRGHRLDVYDAWSAEHGARCVVKVVRPDRLREKRTSEQLLEEGRLLRDFAHPHLVRAYAVLDKPCAAVVMETLTGPNLASLLDERTRLRPADVAILGAQVASALRYLHARDWVHCDVTSGNVIAEGSLAKLIDLSLARRPGVGRPGSGTTGFRAPEQEAGGWISAATDVWGLGAVLHETTTGRLHDEPPAGWLRSAPWPRRTPPELIEAINGCLEHDPDRRWDLARVTAALSRLAPLR